ncbi:MAG: heme ABC exporter ATP-binding protein CcmA [Caulobacteraceae bacterium]
MIDRLSIEALSLARGGRRLFTGVDLNLRAGEAVALTGANGAGKTSLLRAVAGLLPPLSGDVRFGGSAGAVAAADARAHGLHLIGHLDGVKGARRVWDELLFQTLWLGGGAADAERAADRLGVSALLHLRSRALSAGQRRRLALTRLVAVHRDLWLLDEALAPLDAAGREILHGLMADHLSAGGLILAAAHDPLPLASRILRLSE